MTSPRHSAPPTPEELIRLLTVAVRNCSMYTQEHPAFFNAMGQFAEALRLRMEASDHFSLQVARDQILVDQRVLPTNPLLRSLAADLLQRGIQGVTISRGAALHELAVLVEILARKARGSEEEKTSFEETLRARGVMRIWIHPLRVQMMESPGSLSAALLERLLEGKGRGSEGREALEKLLVQDPDELLRLVCRVPGGEGTDEERARRASQRLMEVMEQLLAGHPEAWSRFEDRLAQLLLGLDLQTQLEFFFGALGRDAETSHRARRLAHALPAQVMADLVFQAASSRRTHGEKAGFIRALTADSGRLRELLPEVERKLAEYGVPREEFLRLLEEEPLDLDQRLRVFLGASGMTIGDIDLAGALVQDLMESERGEDALRVVNRVLNAINHPEWEIRKAVAAGLPTLFRTAGRLPRGRETSRKIREFTLRKMLAEPDKEVFRLISEALEEEAFHLLQGGEIGMGLDLLNRIHEALGGSVLEPDYLTRRREALQRGLLGDPLAGRLVQDLAGGSEAEAQRALLAVRLMGEEGVRRVVEGLGDEQQMGRRLRLVRALSELGDLAVEPLRKSLLDPRWYLVRNAVKVLADIGEPRMIPSLVGLLGHPEARVRREVVQALGSTPSPKALDGVMKALEDGDEGVRLRAIEALQTLGGASARERIRLLAFRPAPRDAAVRVKAIKALAAVGMEEEVPLLEALLVRRGLFAKAETEDIRRGAVQALGGILERTGSPRALQLLRGVGETDPVAEVRKLALDLLAPSPTRTGGRG